MFSKEKILVKKTPGSGNSKTKFFSFDSALEVTMVAPGRTAKDFRAKACDILKRFFAGDQTLHAEIDSNARSQHPVAQMARQSLSGNKKQCVETSRTVEDAVDNRLRILQDRLGSYIDIVSNPNVGADVKATYESFILDAMDMLKQAGVPSSRNSTHQLAYIYCTASDAFPDLVKIGRSKIPEARMVGLNTGCAPKPHVLLAQVATLDASRDEKQIHAHFASAREKGEFFRLSLDDVKRYFETVIQPLYIEESQRLLANEDMPRLSHVIQECIGNSKEPIEAPVDDLIELKRQLCEFLEAHLIAKEDSRISSAEISQTFLRMQGMYPEKLDDKRIVNLMNKTIKLAVDGLPGSECVRRNYRSARGLKQMTVYRGIDWVEGDVSEHVAAVRATYSDAQLAEDVC